MRRIDLKRRDYFKVISKVTNRTITVIGLLVDGDKILGYNIDGEGWWDANRFRAIDSSVDDDDDNVNRFEKVEQRVTFDEFYLLEQRVERLEDIIAGLRLYELKKDLEIF